MIAAFVLATVVSVSDLPKPGLGDPKVVDAAGMLSPTEEGILDAKIATLERDLGVETAIVTVPDVEGTAKDFATDLFNRWGLGKKDARNGLLMVVVRDKRRVATETGYGLESVLPDSWLASVQTDEIAPRFRAGNFGGGLIAGFDAIDSRLHVNADEAREGARRLPGAPGTPSTGVTWLIPLVLGGTGFGVLAYLVFLAARARRRKIERCPACKAQMVLLDEVADDAHLSEGERREEALGSIDYRVYVCPQDQTTTIRKDDGVANLDQCPKCRFMTLRRTSKTLEEANYDRGGTVLVTETCEHCDFRKERTRKTRPRTRREFAATHADRSGGSYWWIGGMGSGSDWSSGSSGGWSGGGDSGGGDSGGGFSFGGGDSGGGGADTGW